MEKHCIQDQSSFTGKERDEDTGFGYFGARYMDHELMTMRLSVDPMADKYPGISPYAYCAWNPVKLVDPDGKEFFLKKGIRITYIAKIQMASMVFSIIRLVENTMEIIRNLFAIS